MTENKTGICILITNAFLRDWTGSELYIRDVAMELIKRGHKPIVYSPRLGELADELRKKSIPVIKDLNSISVKPDLIHGQHHLETMTALAQFPSTPVVFFCHGWLPWEETPPLHPRIIQYVTVSHAVRDRLIYEYGIPNEKISTILNSVDLERFKSRPVLPDIPKRALVFNNQANEANILGIIREACASNGMVVDSMGYTSGNPSFDPESQLGKYDIIFAVGRAALESLAIGATVICCSVEGVGQMVTTQNMEWMRHNNFGIRILNRPLTVDNLSAEIQRYDPLDALKVSQEIRATAKLSDMVDQILDVYASVLSTWAVTPKPDPIAESLAFSNYLKGISEKIDQGNLWIEKARILQGELNIIKQGLMWRVYRRLASISLLHYLYIKLKAPIWRWRAHLNNKDES